MDFHRKTLRALNHPEAARTVERPSSFFLGISKRTMALLDVGLALSAFSRAANSL
jgi:hypothetical protein